MTLTAAEVWRDYNTDGVPASGARQPDKREIRSWATLVEAINGGGGPSLGYATKAFLVADLAHAANSLAVVYNDATAGNNGLYVKSGVSGSGSWTRIGDLPSSVIRFDVTGGSANAIEVSAIETPSQPGSKLYLMTPVAQNTDAVTVEVNGGAAVSVKNAFGFNLASGSLLAGSQVLMAWATDHYQLLISANVDAGAILAGAQAAAVEAQNAAIDAAASAASLTYATQVEAEAGSSNAKLMSPLRTVQLIIKRSEAIYLDDYGAIGDGLDSSGSVNRTAFINAVAALPSRGGSIFVPNAQFHVDGNILNNVNGRSIRIYGPGSPNAALDTQTATIVLTASAGSLIAAQGTEGLELDHLNLAYNNASFSGHLIDLAQGSGGVMTGFVHIHHFRAGGLTGFASAESLVSTASRLKVVIEHGYMNSAVTAIVGDQNNGLTAVNSVNIHDIWFQSTSHAPVLVGGSSWNVDFCIFEPRLDGAASAVETIVPVVDSFNFTRNR